MIKEIVLRDFPNWTPEKQLSEYQGYKAMGEYSPFSAADYTLMEMVMNNPNAEIEVVCADGVCQLVKDLISENEAIEAGERIDEAIGKDEWQELVGILFDSLFDDGSTPEEEIPTPKLSSNIKSLLKTIKVQDNRKNDIFYSQAIPTKDINKNMYKFLGGKTAKLTLDRDFAYLKNEMGLNEINKISDLLKVPIIKLLIRALKGDGVNTIIEDVYERDKEKEIAFGIKKLDGLFKAIRKSVQSIKIRLENPEKEESRELQRANRIKEVDELKAHLTTLDQNSQEFINGQENLKLLQYQLDHFDEIHDAVLLDKTSDENDNNNDVMNSALGQKVESDEVNDTEFQATIKDVAWKMIEKAGQTESFNNLVTNLKLDTAKVTFKEKDIALYNSILDGSNKYTTPELSAVLRKIYMKEDKGFGKGELFLSTLLGKNAEIQGGSADFDLKTNGGTGKYEVKSYDVANGMLKQTNGIRLGKDGKVQGFKGFYDLTELIDDIQELFSDDSMLDIFYKMAGSASREDTEELYKILSEKTDGSPALLDILRSGEVTPTTFVKINNALRLTAKIMESINSNDFHYAKLFGKNKNELYSIIEDSLNITSDLTVGYGESASKSFAISLNAKLVDPNAEQKAIEKIQKLLTKPFIKDEKYLFTIINQIMVEINKVMASHPMVLLGNSEAKIYGVYTDFLFVKITQGIVRIAPLELAPETTKKLHFQLSSH